jgi:hypothetical protein
MKTTLIVVALLSVSLSGCDDEGGSGGAGAGASVSASDASAASTASATTAAATASTTGATTGSGGNGPFFPNPALEGLLPGSAMDLGDYACPGVKGEDVSECQRITDFSGMAYDGRNHRLYMFGGGHSSTMVDSVMSLDLSAELAWVPLYEPTPCSAMTPANVDDALGAWSAGPAGPYPRPVSAHTYDFLAASPIDDEFVMLGRAFTGGYCSGAGNDIGGPIAHYDLDGGAWSFSNDGASQSFGDGLAGTELDPVTNTFVSLGTSGLRVYDPATRTVQDGGMSLPSAGGDDVDVTSLGYANHLSYSPVNDTFYYFMRGAPVVTYALVLDRQNLSASTLDLVATSGPTSDHEEPGYDYDTVHQRIGGGILGGNYFAFDPQTATWTSTPIPSPVPADVAFHALEFDPVNEVFVFVGVDQHTWAYRPAP